MKSVRIAVAAVIVLSSIAVLQAKTTIALNDGPAPMPTCDPGDKNCKIPTMNPW